MKLPILLSVLLVATTLWADADINSAMSNETAKLKAYAHGLTTTQFVAKVEKAYAVNDGTAAFRAYVIMWNNQEVVVNDMRASSNLKAGDSIKVVVFRVPAARHAQENHEALTFMVSPEDDVKIPVYQPVPRAANAATAHRVQAIFECRGNELFYADKTVLTAQYAQMLAGNREPGSPPTNTVSDANYTIDPVFARVGMLRLRPREGVHGQTVANLAEPTGALQTILKRLDPTKHQITLFQRDDSSEVAQLAQKLAEAAGFTTTISPLSKDKLLALQ